MKNSVKLVVGTAFGLCLATSVALVAGNKGVNALCTIPAATLNNPNPQVPECAHPHKVGNEKAPIAPTGGDQVPVQGNPQPEPANPNPIPTAAPEGTPASIPGN